MNGSSSLDQVDVTTYGATAKITCNQGFESNITSISCLDTGSWQTSQCTIKDCGNVPKVMNGSASLDKVNVTTYGATATIVCDRGFQTNVTNITCKDTGIWQSTLCSIKDCGPVPDILNGSSSLDQVSVTTFGASAKITCAAGFETNVTNISCLETGNWQTTQCTIRDCGPVPVIMNGSSSLDQADVTTYGSTAKITCDPGFEANITNISCLSTGVWQTSQCTIKDCGPVPTIINGSSRLEKLHVTTYGATAMITCSPGFETNITNISCLFTGIWQTTQCKIKDCGDLSPLDNGTLNLIGSVTTYGASATVNCSSGYNASRSHILCQDNGKWQTAFCSKINCGALYKIPHGALNLSEDGRTSYGSTAYVVCEVGYKASNESIKCLETGEWENASCSIYDCGDPPTISNGIIASEVGGQTTFGAKAFVNCTNGYFTNSETINCTADGTWEEAVCNIKDCGVPTDISDGIVLLEFSGLTTFGAKAFVNCTAGYYPLNDTIECTADGFWEEALCIIKDCGQPRDLLHGYINLSDRAITTFGANASVNCTTGYNASTPTIVCKSSGQWEDATCEVIDCGNPPTISNGIIAPEVGGLTIFGAKAFVNCTNGYFTNSETINCTADGTWEETVCNIKDCGQPGGISNGNISLSDPTKTNFGANASVKCETGYNAMKSTVFCTASGVWEEAQCELIDCGQPRDLLHGYINLSDRAITTFGANASVYCITGYNASTPTIFCKSSGQWEYATCEVIDCSLPPSVSNGNVNLDDPTNTIFGSTATVTCDSGYDEYNKIVACTAAGVWEQPNCVIKDCGKLSSIENGTLNLIGSVTTYGATATVSCRSGYNASRSHILCQDDGQWQTAFCSKINCGALYTIPHGTLNLSEDFRTSYGSTASVECEVGFNASKDIIECMESGKWENASCSIYDCGMPTNISNAIVMLEIDGLTTFGAKATVTCTDGYYTFNDTVKCAADGFWEEAICKIKDCGQLPAIANGNITLDDPAKSTFGSNASVHCDDGYSAKKSKVSCIVDGIWEEAMCIIQDCGQPGGLSNGNISLSDPTKTQFGANASVKCEIGYYASKSTIFCTSTGLWEYVQCELIDCGLPRAVLHGHITLGDQTFTTFGANASVNCNTGYKSSKSTIFCTSSGAWEEASCEILDIPEASRLTTDMMIMIIVLCCGGSIWLAQVVSLLCLVCREHRKHLKTTGKAKCLIGLGFVPVIGIPFVFYISRSLKNHMYYVRQEYGTWDHHAYPSTHSSNGSHIHRTGDGNSSHSHRKYRVRNGDQGDHRDHHNGVVSDTASKHGGNHLHGTRGHSHVGQGHLPVSLGHKDKLVEEISIPRAHLDEDVLQTHVDNQQPSYPGSHSQLHHQDDLQTLHGKHPQPPFHGSQLHHRGHQDLKQNGHHNMKHKHHHKHHKHHLRHHARATRHPDVPGAHHGEYFELKHEGNLPVAYHIGSFGDHRQYEDISGLH